MTPRRPNSLRLQGYDYSQAGMYFVTVVVKDRKHVFGEIVNETMMLNEAGNIVQDVWRDLPNHYTDTKLDEFIVMPNHVHGIIVIQQEDTSISNPTVGEVHEPPLQQPALDRRRMMIPKIIGRFKTVSAKHVNLLHGRPGQPLWQRGFHDRIIRDENELNKIRSYIQTNSLRLSLDQENVTS
jgi:putative transposase